MKTILKIKKNKFELKMINGKIQVNSKMQDNRMTSNSNEMLVNQNEQFMCTK